MAWYKYKEFLHQFTGEGNAYDRVYEPGEIPPHSGIYRCEGCGREIVAEENRQFPPQNHHQHSTSQGKIRWRLIVYADHKPK